MKFRFNVYGEAQSEGQIEAIRHVIQDLAQTYKGAVIAADPWMATGPRQTAYEVIETTNLDSLEDDVNGLIQQGWQLLGPPAVSFLHAGSEGMRYTQALFRLAGEL